MVRHDPPRLTGGLCRAGSFGGEDVIGAFFACEDSSGFDCFYEFRR